MRKRDALHGGAEGAENDGQEERARLAPPVRLLAPEHGFVVFGELVERLDPVRVLCDERALVQQRAEVVEPVFGGERIDVPEELVVRDA